MKGCMKVVQGLQSEPKVLDTSGKVFNVTMATIGKGMGRRLGRRLGRGGALEKPKVTMQSVILIRHI